MNVRAMILSMAALFMLGASWVGAASNPRLEDEAADRARYQGLLRDIKSVDAQYSKALRQALFETQNDGKASLETKSQLLSLRDKRDRIINRITLIALRHGWEIPTGDQPDLSASRIPDERERVFEPAEQMIKDKFALDARRIAGRLNLPVIPIEAVRKDKQTKNGRAKKWLIF